jgi:hypothetical protein
MIPDKIRARVEARLTNARASYWATIEKVARESLSERAADAAADTLAELLPVLGLTTDDVTADTAALHTLATTEQRAADEADAERERKAATIAFSRAEHRATELRAEAQQLVTTAQAHRGVAEGRYQNAIAARSEAAGIRRKLQARGWTAPKGSEVLA